jgi:LDH2 family malate/lactate/ureidoglycolate dehydrogenase
VSFFVRRHKEAETAPGVDEVLLPGEREFRHEAEARARGVPLAPDLLAKVRAIARDLGVDSLV